MVHGISGRCGRQRRLGGDTEKSIAHQQVPAKRSKIEKAVRAIIHGVFRRLTDWPSADTTRLYASVFHAARFRCAVGVPKRRYENVFCVCSQKPGEMPTLK